MQIPRVVFYLRLQDFPLTRDKPSVPHKQPQLGFGSELQPDTENQCDKH